MVGRIHSMESFGTVDGPGIRFVLFLQGCPLRCLYCHNPDTWGYQDGNEMSVDEVVNQILKYKTYIKNGGVTISGGEPLVQIDFVTELLKKLKQHNLHTAIDTSGFFYTEANRKKYDRLMEFCDLVLLDLKHIDQQKHVALTSVSNENTLNFANYLSDTQKPVWIRHVLVPSYSDDVEDLIRLRQFIETLNNVEKIEILPYHTMGVNKYQQLNLDYKLTGVQPPTKASIQQATEIVVKGNYEESYSH